MAPLNAPGCWEQYVPASGRQPIATLGWMPQWVQLTASSDHGDRQHSARGEHRGEEPVVEPQEPRRMLIVSNPVISAAAAAGASLPLDGSWSSTEIV